jgi:hypothetical protein
MELHLHFIFLHDVMLNLAQLKLFLMKQENFAWHVHCKLSQPWLETGMCNWNRDLNFMYQWPYYS